MKLEYKETWKTTFRGLTVEICNWGKDRKMNRGYGVWNYYIYIYEKLCSEEVFKKIWLKDKKTDWGVTHDYMRCILNHADWHGGITYYAKHGHVRGFRCVQVGCDYNHLWDSERGYDYSLEEVTGEALITAEQIADLLGIKEEKVLTTEQKTEESTA